MNADRLRRATAAGALAALAGLLGPGKAHADDLLSLYQQAVQNDPAMQSATHAYDAALERLPQARAGLLPNVGLVGSSGRQTGETSFSQTPDLERGVRNWNWNVQLTQPLWRPANWFAYEQAGHQQRLAGERLHLARQELMLRLTQAYFDALLAEESLRVARSQVRAVGQQLDLASRNFQVGTATVTDVHEAQARRDLGLAQEAVASGEAQVRMAELERILGYLPVALATLRTDNTWPSPPEDALAWMDRARHENPAVLIQEAALAAAEAEISRSGAAQGPTVDLVTSYGTNFASGSLGSPADLSSRVRSKQVSVNLTVPLFAGGAVSARVRETEALRYQAEDDLEAARRLAATQARQAWAAWSQALLQVSALGTAVASSRSAVEDNKIGYRIGTRINIDVLNAEQQLYSTQRDFFKARVDLVLQSLRLKAAAGVLDEADLAAVNRLLWMPA